MATDLERLVVTLEARTKEYERALAKAQGTTISAMRKVERGMQASATRQQAIFAKMGAGINQTLQRSLFGPLAALAGGAGIARLGRSIRSAIGDVAALADEASRAGVQIEELQAFIFAARQEGGDQATLVRAMQRLNEEVGLAMEGSGDLGRRLADLGIHIREANGEARKTNAIFLDIADAVSRAKSQQEAAVLAQKAMTRSGRELLPFLKQGADTIVQTMNNALATGAVIDRELVMRAKKFDDEWTAASDAMGIKLQAAVADVVTEFGGMETVVGFINSEIDALVRGLRETRDEINAIAGAARSVVDFFQKVDDTIRQTGRDLGIAPALGSELEEAKRLLAVYQQNIKKALADGNKFAVEANAAMARSMIETINRLDPGPAFEQLGRQGAAAFERGFQPKVKLPTVTRGIENGASGPSPVSGIIEGLQRSIALQKENDPIAKRMLALQEQLVGATKQEVQYIQRLIAEEEQLQRTSETISSHTGRTADGLGSINENVIGSGDRITSAIGAQTSALSSAFSSAVQTASGSTTMSTGFTVTSGGLADRALGGFESAIMAQQNALSAEAQSLQTALQYKQLSAEEAAAAEYRLAEISIENAKLGQRMADAQLAMIEGMDEFSGLLERMVGRNADSFEHFAAAKAATAAGQQLATSGGSVDLQTLMRMMRMGVRFAGGGEVHGPGGPKSDSVPIMASAGEFVVNAASTKKHRALVEAINGNRLPKMADGGIIERINGAAQRLANGGMVASAPASASRGDISISLGGVNVAAQDGRVSRQSARDAGRQVASEVAYHLREMGIHP